MANTHRGEIDATLDGTTYNLCLTLGALAELESAFGNDNMLALATRFATGGISAIDATRIIGAGLRGAGHEIDNTAVTRMQGDGGAAGFVDIVARLLTATFGGSIATTATAAPSPNSAKAFEPIATNTNAPLPDPFPGTR
jgi:Phage tail tube protein, GTA-gp10